MPPRLCARALSLLVFPWSLAAPVSLPISATVAVATYRGIRRLARRGRRNVARA